MVHTLNVYATTSQCCDDVSVTCQPGVAEQDALWFMLLHARPSPLIGWRFEPATLRSQVSGTVDGYTMLQALKG